MNPHIRNPRQVLEYHSIDPKKSLGQNFLHDPNALARIVEIAELPPAATVLEIGPGTGTLTSLLAPVAGRLYIVETDERLRRVLENELSGFKNVTFYWADFLEIDLPTLVGDNPYFVVANLPYYITSAILRKLLDHTNRPQRLVVTVQKEVAERVIAKPDDMGVLSVSVQFYGYPSIMMRLNPAVFWPRPDVESVVLRIDVYEKPLIEVPTIPLFFEVVRAGFGQKRKQLKNSLSNGLHISADNVQAILELAKIDGTRRAETLQLEEWGQLSWAYAAYLGK